MANPSASNVLGKFIWYDQMSNDLPGAEKFYAETIGWTLAPNTMNDQRYTVLKAGEAMIGGLMPIPEEAKKMGAPSSWNGYIAVDDVKAYADKVKAAGGRIFRPPTDIPNVGAFAVVTDPDGAAFMLFKGNGEGAPTQDPTKSGNIAWHELHSGDQAKAFAFYSDLFGWKKGEAFEMGPMGTYQTFTTKDKQGGGMMNRTPQTPMPFWLYYISVDAIDAASDRAKSAGGRIVHGPSEVPGGGWIVQAFDPQGAMFGMVASKR